MKRHRLFPVLAALVLAAVVGATVHAQAADARIVQSNDGTTYVVEGASAWLLVPDRIGDAQVASRDLTGEIDGAVPASLLGVGPLAPRVSQGSDGALYLTRQDTTWLLIPDPIGDAEAAALNVSGEVNGVLPASTSPQPNINAGTPPPLTSDALRNASYTAWAGGLGAGRTVQLVDGAYQWLADPAPPDGFEVTLYDVSATGDLNGDGVQDVVAIFLETTGYNNINVVLAAFVNKAGQPSQEASILVGDRTTAMKSLMIQSGTVRLDGLRNGPGDALCCPTQPFTHIFRLQGDQLVDLSEASNSTAPMPTATPNLGFRQGCAPVPIPGNADVFIANVTSRCPATDYGRLYILLRDLGNPGIGTKYFMVADEVRDDHAAEILVLTTVPTSNWPDTWNRATAAAHSLQTTYQGHHWQFIGETPTPVADCSTDGTSLFRKPSCWGG